MKNKYENKIESKTNSPQDVGDDESENKINSVNVSAA